MEYIEEKERERERFIPKYMRKISWPSLDVLFLVNKSYFKMVYF
jgi:hypothetical protein